MLDTAITRAYLEKYQKKWDTLYFAIDLHGTIIKRYTGDNIEAYQEAEFVLKMLSKIPDIVLILFTSTSRENLEPFFNWCEQRKIIFKYLNENPECPSNKTGDFSKKFYYNVLIDDRAGFEPETDWGNILSSLKLAQIMYNCPKIETCKRLVSLNKMLLCDTCSSNGYLFNDIQ